jgi:segregation and condensation protein A
VQLGARLLYIKSLALLPRESAAEQADELRQLNLELEEYRRMQWAARQLSRRAHTRSWHRATTERLAAADLPLPDIELPELAEAFSRALKRLEPVQAKGVIRAHVSLETITARLHSRLATGSFDLQSVIDACRDRFEVIITFLALLELIHAGTARVVQAGQFDPITVEATGV